jgi:phosphoenolpyruvate carboxykinase (GTP)
MYFIIGGLIYQMSNSEQILKTKLSEENFEKLSALENPKLHKFVADAVELANPDSVFVCTDSPEDIQYIRDLALKTGEEKNLATKGHTVHFDGYNDQARDKSQTKYLLPEGSQLGESLNSTERQAGIGRKRDARMLFLPRSDGFGFQYFLRPDNRFPLCGTQRKYSLQMGISAVQKNRRQ